MTDQVQCKVTVPGDLHARIKATAALERRSLNQQMVVMLERALESAAATTGVGLGNHAPAVASDEAALAGGPINQR